MTALLALIVVTSAFLAALMGTLGILRVLLGPDLDLAETWCPRCGVRGGRPHPHPGWTERGPR